MGTTISPTHWLHHVAAWGMIARHQALACRTQYCYIVIAILFYQFRPSVCPSRCGIMSERMHISSKNVPPSRAIALVLHTIVTYKILKGRGHVN